MVKSQFTSRMKFFFLAVVLSVAVTACENDDDDPAPVKKNFTLSANANAAQEVPTNSSTGTGTLTGTYDSVANSLTFQVSWTGLTGNVTNMHFHGPALPGVSAGVALAMPGWPATPSGTHSGTLTLTQAQEADLMSGKWYWNIHTAANGGGEIRGQVAVQ
jgi:hypothetical protein